jgi:hypothetical protein
LTLLVLVVESVSVDTVRVAVERERLVDQVVPEVARSRAPSSVQPDWLGP